MSTTETEARQPETSPAPQRRWCRHWYVAGTAAVAAAGGAAAIALTLAGGAPGHAPADILAHDGYTGVIIATTPAQMSALAGGDASAKAMLTYVHRAAVGFSGDGKREEAVLELTPAGAKIFGPLTALLGPAAKDQGLSYRFTDDDLVMVGPVSAFSDSQAMGDGAVNDPGENVPDAITPPAPSTLHLVYGTVYASSATSDAFAKSIVTAWQSDPYPGVKSVYSPETGRSYDVTYQIIGASTVIAAGDNGIFVQF